MGFRHWLLAKAEDDLAAAKLKGRYKIPGSKVGHTIAVKIIDMLGEEVLTTHKAQS